MSDKNLFGLAAEFQTHDELFRAAEKAFAVGYRKMDGFAPFPIEGLAEKESYSAAGFARRNHWRRRRLLHAVVRKHGQLPY